MHNNQISPHHFAVHSLPEFYQVIDIIADNVNRNMGEPLWYRGHSRYYYNLLPSIYRQNDPKANAEGTYSQISLLEDYRSQHFQSRVNHFVQSHPVSKLEWQEIYQHHFGLTRLMDWTESARTALSFSLEPFLDSRDNAELRDKRNRLTPNVWILCPRKLNETVYNFLAGGNGETLVARAWEYGCTGLQEFLDRLRDNKDIYFSRYLGSPKADVEIDGIISLCVLEAYRRTNLSRMEHMVESGEMNPFFYLISRYYSDALSITIDQPGDYLPPLAILQPYHSERIRTQRGTFTIFPNYILSTNANRARGFGCDLRSMEMQHMISDCLYNVRILNPSKVAKELLDSGERRSALYPDIEIYAQIMETAQYHL